MDYEVNVKVEGDEQLKKLEQNFQKITSSFQKTIATIGKLGASAIGSFAVMAARGAGAYAKINNAAYAMTGSQFEASIATEQLQKNLSQSGLEASAAAKKMNALLGAGLSPKLSADLGVALEQVEDVIEGGGAMIDVFQDMGAGLPVTTSNLENLQKVFGITNEQVLRLGGYMGELPQNAQELDKALAQVNKTQGVGKKIVEGLAETEPLKRMIESARISGDLFDRLSGIVNNFFMEIAKSAPINDLLNKLSQLSKNKEVIAKLTEAFQKVIEVVSQLATTENFNKIADSVKWLIDNFSLLKNTIIGLAIGITIFKGIAIALQIVAAVKAVVAAFALLNVALMVTKVQAALAWIAALGPIAWIIAAVVALGAAIAYYVINNWDKVKETFQAVGNWIVNTAFPFIIEALKILGQVLLWTFAAIPMAIYTFWDEIKGAFVAGISFIRNLLNSITEWVSNVGSNIIDGIVNGIMNGAGRLYESIKSVATKALGTFKDVFGIASPSKEMAKIGAFNMQGLQKGQEKESQRLNSLNSSIANDTLSAFSNSKPSNTSTQNNSINISISGGNTEEVKTAIFEVFRELQLQLGVA